MTAIYPPVVSASEVGVHEGDWTFPLLGARLIACNHCGIVALDTPAFGWRRYYDEDGDQAHHCAAAVEQNSWVAQGLVHLKAPDEAIVYENPERWAAELLGEQEDSELESVSDD
jgi:hypothetical protein